MSESEIQPAVLFIFYKEGAVLLSQRPATDSYPEEWVFPGGKKEKFDKNIEETLLRETLEELGVRPLSFRRIPQDSHEY